ncbi:aldehyde dehydrogenase family protein, partial [Bacillus licheniformis]
FKDADVDVAVDQALNAVFVQAGQVCAAGARLLLEESIQDEFVAELVKRAKKIKLGNGFHAETQGGPLISA